MRKIDIKLTIEKSFLNNPLESEEIEIELNNISTDEIIEQLSIDDFIEFYGIDTILDKMSENKCNDYFYLKKYKNIKMFESFEKYMLLVGIRSVEYSYSAEKLADSIEHFRECFNSHTSPYNALLFLYEGDKVDE